MNRNAFATVYFTWPDETKVQVLFAVKSAFLVWMLLNYTDGAVANFMGLEVDNAHELMV